MKSRENLRKRKSTGVPPHTLKKFRADALMGPRVSIATDWNIKSGGREEYLVSFLYEAVSAALPAEWDVECRYESARVLTTVETGKADRLLGYGNAITAVMARAMTSLMA